jgi:photosystem II stability/assembly factor-like uncharacterized protein
MKILLSTLLCVFFCLGGTTFGQDSHRLPNLTKVQFLNDRRGLAVGALENESTIYATENGGQTWKQNYRGVGKLLNIKFVDENIGWAVGSDGVILMSVDSGVTWTGARSGTKLTLVGIAVLDKQNVWVSGDSGLLIHTTDGGLNWTQSKLAGVGSITDIAFFNPSHGVAISYGIILTTNDGGRTWKSKSSGDWKPLVSIQLMGSSRGWIAVGPAVLFTTNGGKTWRHTVPPSQGQIVGLNFINTKLGWIVKSRGEVGSIIHLPGKDRQSSESFVLSTTDGGASWKPMHHIQSDINLSAWANDVFFLGAKKGWIVGDDGLVLKTIDGGVRWQQYSWIITNAELLESGTAVRTLRTLGSSMKFTAKSGPRVEAPIEHRWMPWVW